MPSLARGIHEVSVRGQMWREVGLWPTHDRPVSFKVHSSPAHVLGPLPRAPGAAGTAGGAGGRGRVAPSEPPASRSTGRGTHLKAWTRLRSANSWSSTKACSTLMLNSSLERQGAFCSPLRPPGHANGRFLELAPVGAALPALLRSGSVQRGPRGALPYLTTAERPGHVAPNASRHGRRARCLFALRLQRRWGAGAHTATPPSRGCSDAQG